MPKKPSPPNPDKDRRAFLRFVLLDPSSTQTERKAALEELEQLLRAIPNPEPTGGIEPSAQKRPPIQPLPLKAFLPKDPPPSSGQKVQKVDKVQEDPDMEEVVVQPAKPAKYGPATASQDSFRASLKSAMTLKVALGYQQRYFYYHGSTVDAGARADVQDLRNRARNTHPVWEVDAEMDVFRLEIENDPMIWARAVLDISGEYIVFNQQLIEQDIQKRLQGPLPAEVKSILEEALRRARSLEPTGKAVKHYTGAKPADLQLDVPGELIEPGVAEVREKRKREPAPRINIANANYFDRILASVPTVPPPGPPLPAAGAVRNMDAPSAAVPGDLERYLTMSPKEQSEFRLTYPERFAAMTLPQPGGHREPVFQEIRDNTGKRLTLLDRYQVVEVTRAKQDAEGAILSCRNHEARNCACWSRYRSLLRSHQDINPDSPMSIALGFYYDQLAELAAHRPKKDEAMEALRRLNEKMDTIAEQPR